MEEIVFLNGRFLPVNKAKIPISDPGFLLGFGVFETMRSDNNRIVYLEEHLKRIKEACRLIKIRFPYSLPKLKDTIKRTIKTNNFKDAYVRLTLWKAKKGTGTLIIVKKYRPHSFQKYKTGFKACISQFSQNENHLLPHLKTTSFILYRLAYARAEESGFDEAIILNNRGYVSEGSRSNIFLVKDNTVFTPSLSSGCLAGITRKAIFDLAKIYNIKIYEGNFTLRDLHTAEEIFLTNSLMGVMPLTSLQKELIAKGSVGRVTKFFMKKYNLLLKNAI